MLVSRLPMQGVHFRAHTVIYTPIVAMASDALTVQYTWSRESEGTARLHSYANEHFYVKADKEQFPSYYNHVLVCR